jgi:RNA polymerase sigma-70 factor (sigma-E family)
MRHDQERVPVGDDLEQLLAERGNWLMGIAIALTGERADAEDLLQAALERLLRNRRRVTFDTEAYLRRTLYNLAADGWRRRGVWRRKIPLLRAEQAGSGAGDATATVDLRDELVRLLLQLPPHQRAVIMLRYWEQLSEAEAAEVLGCTKGAVKSAASKGIRRLRELAGLRPDAADAAGQNGWTMPAHDTGTGPPHHLKRGSGQQLIDLARERS